MKRRAIKTQEHDKRAAYGEGVQELGQVRVHGQIHDVLIRETLLHGNVGLRHVVHQDHFVHLPLCDPPPERHIRHPWAVLVPGGADLDRVVVHLVDLCRFETAG